MMQKPVIYVSRITNLSDARYCAGMGVDMLGFIVDPAHADYVSPSHYREMLGWISGPERVIELTGNETASLPEIIEQYQPNLIHLPFDSIHDLSAIQLPLIFDARQATASSGTLNIPRKAEYVLMREQTSSMSGKNEDQRLLIFIEKASGSLIDLMKKSKAVGFALQGTPELAPGLKDYDHLSNVLEELEGSLQ